MAVTEQVSRPAPFVEKLGTNLAENVLAQQGVPVVTGGLGSLGTMAQPDKQAFETDDQFKARQDLFGAQQRAALGFEQRQQALAGLAPQVAGQDALQGTAQDIAKAAAGVGTAQEGLGSFQPFLQRAQEAGAASTGLLGNINAQNLLGTGVDTRTAQQKAAGDPASLGSIESYMSPYQTQVIDASLAEFDRNRDIQEQRIRDQQTALGALGSGRAGVQLAEFGTGAARERALLQAGLLQQGFGQAQAARQQDIANRGALSSQQLQLGQFQSGLGGQAQGILGSNVSRLGQLGALNQAQTQAGLDATREATRQAAFLPQEQLDRFGAQVTGIMGGYPGQTVSTNVPNPTPLQTALGVGTTLAGIYGGVTGKFKPGAFN
jgi:hypothetical protein